MATENLSAAAAPHAARPLPTAVRQRLQKVFDHAQRCLERQDYDYAIQLLTQCVAEDPGNLIYVQTFLGTLQKKFGDKRKPSAVGALKLKSLRSSLHKAIAKGAWESAFQTGCAALAISPWDGATLLQMADACRQLSAPEAELYYLRWALSAAPKDPVINRAAGLTLQRMGQFEQAIACWRRVKEAKPEDEEASLAVSRLSVEKTIHDGGYDPELLGSGRRETEAAFPGTEDAPAEDGQPQQSPEERLRQIIANDPADIAANLRLADLLAQQGDIDAALAVLETANQATGGGEIVLRDRIEDVHIRQARRQVQIAEQHHGHEQSEDSARVLAQARNHANQVELEVYTARSDRDPQVPWLKYELGLRLRRAGKYKEAITALQAARSDAKRKAMVLLELGECFQKIEQYKLAMSNYEAAIEASEDPESDVHKLSLYRAGVLATGLRELDLAERHLTALAGIDFGFRDVAERLDNLNKLRDSG